MMPLSYFLAACAGGVAGFLGALFGIGGGIFLIPVLVLAFGLPMHTAVAASIVAVIATSSATAAVYVQRGQSNIRLGISLEVMTVIGALLGGLLANQLAGGVLRRIFAVFLVVMAGLMWYRARLHGEGAVGYDPAARLNGVYFDSAEGRTVEYSVRRLGPGMIASFIAGNMSGLLGVGGGIVKVPVMNMVCGVPIKAATATSNFMIGVTAVASAFLYLMNGHMHPYYTAAAALGVFAGSFAGTRVAARIKSRTLVQLFILLLVVVAVRMFF